MKIPLLSNLFARSATRSEVSGALRSTTLYSDQATDNILTALTQVQDPDYVLKAVGLQRKDLKRMESDDEVMSALETRRDALAATPWRLEPGTGRIASFVWEELEKHMEQIISGSFEALPYGYSVMEGVYYKDNGKVRLDRIQAKPMEWFSPQRDGTLRYYDPAGISGAYGAEGEQVDNLFKFFVTRHRPTYRQPYGEALLSRLYWPWFFRYNGWRFWLQFVERFGNPMIMGTVQKPADFVKALTSMGIDSAIAVGKDETVKAESPAGPSGGETFERLEAALCRRVQKTILGQTLTTDTSSSRGGGSYAAAKVHDLVRMDKRNADIRMITPTVQMIIDALVKLNFGVGAKAPKFVMEDGQGLEPERATRDATLVNAGILKFTEDYILRVYDLEPEDFTIPEIPQPLADANGVDPKTGEAVDPDSDPNASPEEKDRKKDEMKKDENADPEKAAGAGRPLQFAAGSRPRFTSVQMEVERLADDALAAAGQPIDPEAIRSAIFAATDPQDLEERLAILFAEVDPAEFRTIVERAMFAADVLGYVHAAERK